MKYKGIELKEETTLQIFNPPKLMLVWDADDDVPVKLNVCAIVNRDDLRVITERSPWRHCAEIPEQLKKLVTYRELARWLAEGNGEVLNGDTCCPNWNYHRIQENDLVSETMLVQKWSDTDWHKPTREYLGLESQQ